MAHRAEQNPVRAAILATIVNVFLYSEHRNSAVFSAPKTLLFTNEAKGQTFQRKRFPPEHSLRSIFCGNLEGSKSELS